MRLLLAKLTRRTLVGLAAVAMLLLGLRAALPVLVTDFVNERISSIPGMRGSVRDVDLHLWRGAYTIHRLELTLVQDNREVPFITVPTFDLSVEWRALLNGDLVGEGVLYRPQINIVTGAAEAQGRRADDVVQRLRELSPLRVNRFEVVDGELHFRNFAASPDVDIYLDEVNFVARNLTNSKRLSDTLAATVSSTGRVMESGRYTLEMKIDPFEKRPTYTLAFELEDLRLPELNTFLKHYLAVTARDGWISMYVESSASEGRFKGYVKPLTRDLDILHIAQEDQSLIDKMKGFFVKIFANVFENQPKDQLASRIEFSGSFEDPDISIWEAVTSFLRNAFVRAIRPGLEGSVAPAQTEDVREGQD